MTKETLARVRIGVAGWSYPDWEGRVYARNEPNKLAYVARFFDLIEINSSFYRTPSPGVVRRWAQDVSGIPGFRFTAKLGRVFTHDRRCEDSEARAFAEAMGPLTEAGLLEAVLAQFPASFKAGKKGQDLVLRLAERFGPVFPLAIEVRSGSWVPLLGWLREIGYRVASLDMPRRERDFPPIEEAAGGFAYVRFHGRNQEAWFRKGAGRDQKYDYLYSEEEMKGWARILESMAGSAERVLIVANNHYRGKAAANALQLRSILMGAKAEAPPLLVRAYPQLERWLQPRAERGSQLELFY